MFANIIARLMPFLLFGMFLVVAGVGFVVLSSVLVWGMLIGGILFIAATIKHYFFPNSVKTDEPQSSSKGRVIDYDDL